LALDESDWSGFLADPDVDEDLKRWNLLPQFPLSLQSAFEATAKAAATVAFDAG
jgi:hypothetical protein